MTPNTTVAMILVVAAVSMAGIWLTATWVERKIRRIIHNASAEAMIIAGLKEAVAIHRGEAEPVREYVRWRKEPWQLSLTLADDFVISEVGENGYVVCEFPTNEAGDVVTEFAKINANYIMRAVEFYEEHGPDDSYDRGVQFPIQDQREEAKPK